MAYDFEIKRGALEPALKLRATQATGDPIDLTGAVVVLRMRNHVTGAMKITDVACVVTAPLTGDFEYRWAGTDTDTPGDYEVEVHVTFLTGRLLVLPTGGVKRGRVYDVLT